MSKRNLKYEHGYSMGYDWVAYEGGNIYTLEREIKNRNAGAPVFKVWDHGFRQGAKDRLDGLDKKYDPTR